MRIVMRLLSHPQSPEHCVSFVGIITAAHTSGVLIFDEAVQLPRRLAKGFSVRSLS